MLVAAGVDVKLTAESAESAEETRDRIRALNPPYPLYKRGELGEDTSPLHL